MRHVKSSRPGPSREPSPADVIRASRERIDRLDDTILDLLVERADIARTVGNAKRRANMAVFHDPEREERVLARLGKKAQGRFPPDTVRTVWREVISACLSVEQPLRVAFLGPAGTFSQLASRKLFGLQARYRDCATIHAVFDAVSSGDATYGVVPVENSTEGAVSTTTDALLDGSLRIRQELILPIDHCLLSRSDALSSIERVYSHPQAIAQCQKWLARNLPRAQVIHSTSTTAAAVEAATDERAAAIASELASEVHGVPILQPQIQDLRDNATRFVVVAKEDAPVTGQDRTTLAFGVRDKKGALRRVLQAFEEADVNLTRIESRPSKKKAWHYVFLVDVDGHRTDASVTRGLRALRKHVDFVKIIGSYPRAVAHAAEAKPRRSRTARAGT